MQLPADLVTFAEEICNGKLYFFRRDSQGSTGHEVSFHKVIEYRFSRNY